MWRKVQVVVLDYLELDGFAAAGSGLGIARKIASRCGQGQESADQENVAVGLRGYLGWSSCHSEISPFRALLCISKTRGSSPAWPAAAGAVQP